MVLMLNLDPAVILYERLRRTAFFTGLTIYLEAVTILVLVTSFSLSPAILIPAVPILAAQVVFVREPAGLILHNRLRFSYRFFLGSGVLFILMLTLATSGELRWTSSVLGAIVF